MKFALLARLCIVIFCIHNMTLNATYPINQQWLQKNSSNFKIIFQENDDQKANDLLNFLEHHHKKLDYEKAPLSKQFPIILHPFYNQSNGFVAWMPRRSELYTLSSPQTYTFLANNSWMNLLAIHEYRHIAQQELILSKDFFKKIQTNVGELYSAFFAFLYMPLWYFEGDAVITESTASNYGRGREASFTRLARINAIEYPQFSYQKQILGSYKQPIPDHYSTGYIILNYLKNTYGTAAYNTVINNTFNTTKHINPLNKTLKKELSISKKTLYKNAFDQLKKEQEKNMLPKDPASISIAENNRPNYRNFLYPIEQSQSTIIALHQSSDETSYYVAINPNGQHEKICHPGPQKSQLFNAVSNRYIAWINSEVNLLYSNILYSNIVLYDLESKSISAKSKHSFFDSVTISADENKVAALEQDPYGVSTLSILSLPTLTPIKKIPLSDGVYSFIHFINNTDILAIRTKDEEKSVVTINTQNMTKEILYSTYENIGTPRLANSILFLSLSYKGNDRILAVDLKQKKRYIFAESSYGTYYPSISKDQQYVYFNTATKNGFNIYKKAITLNSLTEIPYNEASKRPIDLSFPKQYYTSTTFNAWKHYFQPIEYTLYPESDSIYSLSVSSVDLMSHLAFSNTFTYNLESSLYDTSLTAIFSKYNPKITLSYTHENKELNGDTSFTWQENSLKTGLVLPWIKQYKDYTLSATLNPELSFTRLSNYKEDNIALNINQQSLEYLSLTNTILNRRQQATQELAPRSYQSLSTTIYKTLSSSTYEASYQSLNVSLYFPGLSKTHSFQTKAKIATQENQDYSFDTSITYIEGFNFNQTYTNFNGVKLDYYYPLSYPDLSIMNLIYIQRISQSFYSHFGKITYSEGTLNPAYIGSRFHFDTKFGQINTPIKFTFTTFCSINTQDYGLLIYFSF